MERKETQVVELKTSLMKGCPHTKHDYRFGTSLHGRGDEQFLRKLSELVPMITPKMRLARTSDATTRDHQLNGHTTTYSHNCVYNIEFRGVFEIPWVINASVINNEVVVDYKVLFSRPDSSLAYQLIHQKELELFYLTYNRDGLKNRTRIDGLPAYLRTEEARRSPGLNPRITGITELFRRGIDPVPLEIVNGNLASLSRRDKFEGDWSETWYLWDDKGKMEVESFEVCLNGSWM